MDFTNSNTDSSGGENQMAVPKRKMSKARRDQRRANWKLEAPGFVACPQCHEPKMPHHVCPECGYYDGKEVVKAAE
jgi:large subunit ribosomal protein L32